jgi:putative addiction module killer protein
MKGVILGLITVLRTIEYIEWFKAQKHRDQAIIANRLTRIAEDDYFGDYKYLGNYLFELRWKNGRRIYYTKTQNQNIYLLLGGFKNGQKKDIKQAQKILNRGFSGG